MSNETETVSVRFLRTFDNGTLYAKKGAEQAIPSALAKELAARKPPTVQILTAKKTA